MKNNMGKTLAIVGHPTHGEEVIELLKMMGGRNEDNIFFGKDPSCIYFIDNYRCIRKVIIENNIHTMRHWHIFTLEEFLEKYPFKIGDQVVYTKYGDNCDDYPLIIKSMKWTGTTIEYAFDGYVTCLAKDLKMWNEEPDAVILGIHLNSCDYADEVELNLGDYEIIVRDGKTYAVRKKPAYPDNYEECVRIAKNIHGYDIHIDAPAYRGEAELFIKLLICRDAYWKIAGEEMGLGKPWEPNWTTLEGMPAIFRFRYNIVCDSVKNQHCLLVFPTEEMRDAFYKNFKDLIESCKELL